MTQSKNDRLRAGKWSVAPALIMQATTLSPGAKLVYFALDSFVQNRECTSCTPTLAEIGAACNMAERTVRGHVRELEKVEAIRTAREWQGNRYEFLELRPELLTPAQDNATKQPTNRQEPAGHSPTNRQEPAGYSPTNRQKPAGANRQEPAGDSAAPLYSAHSNQGEKTTAASTATTTVVRGKGKRPGDWAEANHAAAAFLNRHFSKTTTRKLLGITGPYHALCVQRRFEAKRTPAYNSAGLITYMLREEIPESEALSEAREVLYERQKAKIRAEAGVNRAEAEAVRAGQVQKAKAKSLQAWLDEQPDREALAEQAGRHARLTAGGKADFKTLMHMRSGYLWQARKRRENAGLSAAIT